MSATVIVAVFSFLSACSSGKSVGGLLSMLSAMRYVVVTPASVPSLIILFKLDFSLVLVSEQSIHVDPYRPPNSLKSRVLEKMHRIDGLHWRRVRAIIVYPAMVLTQLG